MENLFDKQYKKLEVVYQQALYVCLQNGEVIKIGENSRGADALLTEYDVREICVLTADNPRSRLLTEEDNREALVGMRRMLEREGYEFLSGVNQDPKGGFPDEDSVWVLGMDAFSGKKYGKQFEQNAFVYYRKGGLARLEWCVSFF